MAEAVHMRTYPTEHGRGANATYGIMLEQGRREIGGVLVCPDFDAYHEAPHHRLRHRCVRRQYCDANQRQSSTIRRCPDGRSKLICTTRNIRC